MHEGGLKRMEQLTRRSRPLGITIIAIIMAIQGILGIIGGIMLLAGTAGAGAMGVGIFTLILGLVGGQTGVGILSLVLPIIILIYLFADRNVRAAFRT